MLRRTPRREAGGIPGRLYLEEGWAVEQAISGLADGIKANPKAALLDLLLGGHSGADVSRVVVLLEARATRPNDLDRGQIHLGYLVPTDDLRTAQAVRDWFAARHGRPLRWA